MMERDGSHIREVLFKADDIYDALLEQNKRHFHQAFDTPFGGGVNDGILAELVGYSGLMTAAKAIVDGNFMAKYDDKVDFLPETTQLIIEMAMPEEIRNLG
jgi:hypothetical protein